MSDNLRRYTRALFSFDATVARAGADTWANSSPCDDWTATDVVAHNVGMNQMIVGFTEGSGSGSAGHPELAQPDLDWTKSFEALLAALDSSGALQTVAKTPWGEMPIDRFLGFAWVDPILHTWDLAKATGQTPTLPADLVAIGAKQLARAGDSLRGTGAFGDEVKVAEGASTLELFVGLSGRDPGWS